MRRTPNLSRSWILAPLLSLLGFGVYAAAQTAAPAPPAAKVSAFGQYSGYSEPVYDSWVRSSRYVTVRDGTRLAVDLFRPTRGGKVAEERLPVVWTFNRYRCAFKDEGKVITVLDAFEWLQDVLRHGYVVACVDTRGGGASFGRFEGMFNTQETRDAYDVTEWLAAQSWSNGKIGMYGRSYLGITQYMAAGQKPPHLVALFPEVAVADMYELIYKGGIYHGPFIELWTGLVHKMDVEDTSVPVDADKDGSLLKAAIAEHRANRSAADVFAALPYRDSVDAVSKALPFRDWTPITYLQQIRESKVAVYHLAGWYDRYVCDQLVLFRNLQTNPQRISIGPWTHTQSEHFDFAAEHLRWWDYWLKGIDNGVMQEEPVHYYVMGAPEDKAWRSARSWPLPQERRTAYWFGPGRSLGPEAPQAKGAKDDLTVDDSAAIAPDPRWSLEQQFPELSANDAKGLTYTTTTLPAALEVTGHPVVHLWVSSSAPDADVFAYLEEVDEKGASRYVTEGMLRASNRATATPDYDLMGLPYHRGLQADRQPLTPGQPVELVFDLYPTSTLFQPGHRIRVTITGADKANARTPERKPPPRLTVWREAGRGSWIDLPVIPAADPRARTLFQKLKPCKVEGLQEEVLCGTLSVWENRTTKTGRKIDLYTAVLPARSANPAPDPVFYINGGPGYGSAGAASGMGQALGEIRKQRDVVLVDQRGTGKSHPLHCPLPGSDADLQGYMRTLFPMDVLRACEPQLAREADLTQYTTEFAMDDLDEVRAWLGYDRINVFGGSYGTRAAQAYMRQHPDHVRSAILAGVMIMDARMPLYHAVKAQQSIDKLFDDCAADEACRTAFPDLRGDLAKVVARLDQGPVKQTVQYPAKTGKPVELSIGKGAFTTTLRSMQYSPFLSARIPLYVHLAAQGDFRPMMLMTIFDRIDPNWDIGLYLSITCAEDVARIDPKDVPALIANTYQGDDRIRDQKEACSFWPRARVAEDFFKPVESLAPTLLLTGWLDPATPPEWAAEVSRHLPNSLNVVIRDGAHGPGGLSHIDCYFKLINDFVANGTPFGLDTSCAKEMKRRPFLIKDEPLPGN